MKFKIEDNVPMPPVVGRTGINDALSQMQPGQSLRIEGTKQSNTQASISYARRKTGFKFSTRKEADGVSIWRTA